MIEIKDLLKKFNNHVALNIPLLNIIKGEVVGLIGNNGAGKTTLFRLMLDLLCTDSGYVKINGIDVSKNEEWKLSVGSFLSSNFLIDFLTPDEYFLFVGKMFSLKDYEIKERLIDYKLFMNGEILSQKKYIRNFSTGNKQKIGIVAAMMVNPEILFLDEPFNFLDPSTQIEMKRLLQWSNAKFNTTIILSSHNLNYVYDVSSHIILLEKGLIIKNVDNLTKGSLSDISHYFSN